MTRFVEIALADGRAFAVKNISGIGLNKHELSDVFARFVLQFCGAPGAMKITISDPLNPILPIVDTTVGKLRSGSPRTHLANNVCFIGPNIGQFGLACYCLTTIEAMNDVQARFDDILVSIGIVDSRRHESTDLATIKKMTDEQRFATIGKLITMAHYGVSPRGICGCRNDSDAISIIVKFRADDHYTCIDADRFLTLFF